MAKKEMITLQSHIDMVPQKAEGKIHDFTKDAIKAYVDGDFVKAEGTTLGADNAIGVAAMMAVIESKDIEHGPLEAFFTVDEETGMDGVNYLKNDLLKGKYLINTDSEEEGELSIGCAGGVDVGIIFEYKKAKVPQHHNSYRITVTGLKGGHSGSSIHEGRGNSIKIMARLLSSIRAEMNFYISEFNGGTLRNVIPSKAEIVLLVKREDDKKFRDIVSDFSVVIKKEYKFVAPHLLVTMNEAAMPVYVLDKEAGYKIICALHCCPNEVFRMDDNLHIVQTSSNLGVIKTNDATIEIKCLARSLVESARDYAGSTVGTAFKLAGAKVVYSGVYPGWVPNVNSILLQVTKDSYKELFNKEPKVTAVHAGLECGLIGAKYPGMDMVSFGPTIKDAHSVNERVSIKSVESFFKYLCVVLKNIR
jgi:dipeptidase D